MSDENFTMDELQDFVRHVFGFMEGAVVAGTIYLGDRLDLYKALRGAGPVTADELAERTGLDRRWLTEWLRAQASAELITYRGDDRFELTQLGSFVLADEESSPAFAAGAFCGLPDQLAVLPKLEESFRTGIGLPFDAQGAEGNHAIERMFAPWVRQALVPLILPSLEGVTERLEAGGAAADVGCGAGIALCEMAKAFPDADFHGYDISQHALTRAEGNRTSYGVENVTFHHVRGEALPDDGRFDLVCAFDCIHDMTRPGEVLGAIRRAVADDGTVLIGDIKAKPTFEDNLEGNPMAALMYGMSILSCLSSATSEPDGAGLGTLGFHAERAQEMTEAAGFTRFRAHDFEHPVHVYYEVRP